MSHPALRGWGRAPPCPAWVGMGSGLRAPPSSLLSWGWVPPGLCSSGQQNCTALGVRSHVLHLELSPPAPSAPLTPATIPQSPRPANLFLAPGSLPSAGHTFGIPVILKERKRKTCPAPTSLWLLLPLPKGHLDTRSLPPPPSSSLQAAPLIPVLNISSLWVTFL